MYMGARSPKDTPQVKQTMGTNIIKINTYSGEFLQGIERFPFFCGVVVDNNEELMEFNSAAALSAAEARRGPPVAG